MPRGRWKTVTLREDVYDTLMNAYKQKSKELGSKAFTAWLNDYLLESFEDSALLQKYAPALEYIGTSANTIIIKDHLEDIVVEVEVRKDDKLLYCRECESNKCLHVGFCFATREVNDILIKHGFKKPRVIE